MPEPEETARHRDAGKPAIFRDVFVSVDVQGRSRNFFLEDIEGVLAVGKYHEIVHIPDVSAEATAIHDVMIQTVQIPIGPYLAGHIPYGQAPASLQRRKQHIAGKPVALRFGQRRHGQYVRDEPLQAGNPHFFASEVKSISRSMDGKVLADVAFQHIEETKGKRP